MTGADILYRAAMRRSVDTAKGVSTPRSLHYSQFNFQEGGRWFTRVGMVIRDRETLTQEKINEAETRR